MNGSSGQRSFEGLPQAEALKQCCASAYESDAAKLLVGDSFHPGGVALTKRLGQLLGLGPQSRVLDVAAGRGTSALALATTFGCDVIGLDYSQRNVDDATRLARKQGLGGKVIFSCADAERLPFADESFDAVLCECALCTFPNKAAAAAEFARVLRSGGQVGLSDLTRQGTLSPELETLTAWIACVADAQPLSTYADLLRSARLTVTATEEHNGALLDFIDKIRMRILMADVMVGLKNVPGLDLGAVKDFVQRALAAVKARQLGYALLIATRREPPPRSRDAPHRL